VAVDEHRPHDLAAVDEVVEEVGEVSSSPGR
jgi:hypothetical protein